jgi:hypothetical protein
MDFSKGQLLNFADFYRENTMKCKLEVIVWYLGYFLNEEISNDMTELEGLSSNKRPLSNYLIGAKPS